MTMIKAILLVGTLAISSTSAFAQTIVPTAGVDFGSPSYDAYQRANRTGSDAHAGRVRRADPARQAPVARTRTETTGQGYVSGGSSDRR
jgi:hypothetical protein